MCRATTRYANGGWRQWVSKAKDSNGHLRNLPHCVSLIYFVTMLYYTGYHSQFQLPSSKAISGYETTSISLYLHLSPFVQRVYQTLSSSIAWNFWLGIHHDVLWLIMMVSEAQHSSQHRKKWYFGATIYSPTWTAIGFLNNLTWKLELTTRSIRSIPFLSLVAKINPLSSSDHLPWDFSWPDF